MKALKGYFLFVLAAMAWTTGRASLDRGVLTALRDLAADPWGLATLFDASFAFLTFCLRLACKESSVLARGLWLAAILLLGNFAMAGYVRLQLFRLPPGATATDLLLRREVL